MPTITLRVALAIPVLSALIPAVSDAIAPKVPEDMVTVPAGAFIMGDEGPLGLPDEAPRLRREIAAFRIDRTEVTNAAYQVFLEACRAGKCKAFVHPDQPQNWDPTPRYWKTFVPELIRRSRVGALLPANRDTFRQPDHPVVGVSWFDAYAYCAFRGVRLPSEQEWEKAARGTDGRIWPWGNAWQFDRANTGGYERDGERDGYVYTAPAGAYAAGASPWGALNMAGNVWEWTASAYSAVSAEAARAISSRGGTDVVAHRVVKGGAFNSLPSSVRPARRDRWERTYKAFNLGFRCATGEDAP